MRKRLGANHQRAERCRDTFVSSMLRKNMDYVARQPVCTPLPRPRFTNYSRKHHWRIFATSTVFQWKMRVAVLHRGGGLATLCGLERGRGKRMGGRPFPRLCRKLPAIGVCRCPRRCTRCGTLNRVHQGGGQENTTPAWWTPKAVGLARETPQNRLLGHCLLVTRTDAPPQKL